MSIGLHILYGKMGSGKTNYSVNELLAKTTYKHVICNVPLSQEFIDKLKEKEINVEIIDKYKPAEVIQKINSNNPQTFFIVDESQLVLTAANAAFCKNFANKLTQIRQDDQDVNLIAQSSKMLHNMIKDVATDCYKFLNNNEKGLKKSSHVEKFTGGFDYQNKKTEEFTYNHVYGNYQTSNWETTEKPKNLYKKVYVKIVVIFVVLIILSIFLIMKISSLNKKTSNQENKEQTKQQTEQITEIKKEIKLENDSLCVRSFHYNEKGIVYYVTNKGDYKICSPSNFAQLKRCPLF